VTSLRLAFLGDPGSVHLHRWLAAFVERGHAVCLLVPRGGDSADAGGLPGVEVRLFRSVQDDRSPGGLWRARADLRRELGAWGADVLHAHYARSPAWHAWLSGRRPYVVTVWGSEVLRADAMPRLGRLFTRLALRDAALVTASTPASTSRCSQKLSTVRPMGGVPSVYSAYSGEPKLRATAPP
jgi:hypothetical protein